ncbi:MAG: iron-sulfur cluster insertion protein ErpA [Candidatus Thermoplasmatota archaeon]|nr:iron-sulfur cluster insertion protein ErpA [Candidatus Thermoplasmatota archaeon]
MEIFLTEAASQKIRTLMENDGDNHSYLRVFVSGGGCSGLSYGMTFEEMEEEGDRVVESSGVKVLVDEFSAPYLKGVEVDYQESLMGTGFVINNPNAKSSCACGQSFSA